MENIAPKHLSPAACSLYMENIRLPEELNRSIEDLLPSRSSMWLFDTVLPKLGLGKVECVPLYYEGTLYYEVTVNVLFRNITFVLRPLSAYFLGMACVHVARNGYTGSLVTGSNDSGYCYVPGWALFPMMEVCKGICQSNEKEVQFLIASLRDGKFLGTIEEPATDEETPAPDRVLH
jgi:hypothetical protein